MTHKLYRYFTFALLFASFSVHSTKFQTAEFIEANGNLHFNPKFQLDINEKIKEAIDNGIQVTFVMQVKFMKEVDWWYDSLISSKIQTFKINYFSMSRQYRLHNITLNNEQNFISLEAALKELSQNTTFISNSIQGFDYIETRIFLDKQALPSTMQLPTVFDQDWNINSDWQSIKPPQLKGSHE